MRIPAAETFEALQRGTVDAVIGAASGRYGFGQRGVYKYILRPPLYFGMTYWFISAPVWDGLPDQIKTFLKSLSIEFQKKGYPWSRKWEDETIMKYMDEDNVKPVWATPEEERKIAKAYREAFLDWVVNKSPKYGPRIYELLKDRVY